MEPEQENTTVRKDRYPSQCLTVDMAEGDLWLVWISINWWLGRWLNRTQVQIPPSPHKKTRYAPITPELEARENEDQWGLLTDSLAPGSVRDPASRE